MLKKIFLTFTIGVKKDGRNEFVSTGCDFQNVAGFGIFVAGFTENVVVK